MKSGSKLSGMLVILLNLGPGEAEGILGVRVKRTDAACSVFAYSLLIPRGPPVALSFLGKSQAKRAQHIRRSAGTDPTVRDESQGSKWD